MPPEVQALTIRVKREPRIEGDVAYIPLTKGYEAVIDLADLPLVAGRNWYAHDSGCGPIYAANRSLRGMEYLHRTIMGDPIGSTIDHRDTNTMNCRRSNLRAVSRGENNMNLPMRKTNTSGFKGVSPYGKNGRFVAKLQAGGRQFYLGSYATPEEAHAAYREAASKHHGEFANHG